MALSVFGDPSRPPRGEDLAEALGNTFVLWNELQSHVASRFAPVSTEWGFTSKSTGWGLRLKQEKRAILYMIPCEGYFLASFALGEKAARAAHGIGLPGPVLAAIDGAKKYAEGRGVRLEVRNGEDVRNVETLALVKMAN